MVIPVLFFNHGHSRLLDLRRDFFAVGSVSDCRLRLCFHLHSRPHESGQIPGRSAFFNLLWNVAKTVVELLQLFLARRKQFIVSWRPKMNSTFQPIVQWCSRLFLSHSSFWETFYPCFLFVWMSSSCSTNSIKLHQKPLRTLVSLSFSFCSFESSSISSASLSSPIVSTSWNHLILIKHVFFNPTSLFLLLCQCTSCFMLVYPLRVGFFFQSMIAPLLLYSGLHAILSSMISFSIFGIHMSWRVFFFITSLSRFDMFAHARLIMNSLLDCTSWLNVIWISESVNGHQHMLHSRLNPSTVVHPIASLSIRTQRNAQKAIVFTWVSIMFLCIPVLFYHAEQDLQYRDESGVLEKYQVCQFLEELKEYNSTYQLIFFMFSFVVPILLIFFLYVLMLKRLWFGNVPGGQMSSESVRSKVRSKRQKSRMTQMSLHMSIKLLCVSRRRQDLRRKKSRKFLLLFPTELVSIHSLDDFSFHFES